MARAASTRVSASAPEPPLSALGLSESPISERIARTMRAEGDRGRWLQLIGRTGTLAVCALLVGFLAPWPPALFYLAIMLALALFGLVQIQLERRAADRAWRGRRALPYVFAALDFALVTAAMLTPNPLLEQDMPVQMLARVGNEVFLYPVLLSLVFSFDPWLVLWGGGVAASCWATGVGMIALRPDSLPMLFESRQLELHLRAGFVDLGVLIQQCVIFVVAGGLLAMSVERTRRLVRRQAMLERDRANLARYFSPAVVDRLAEKDGGLARIGERRVAVMFTDLVGFTAWSESADPDAVLTLLRDVHAQIEAAVFARHGAVDKFIGDGVMATFGAPEPGRRDASNALACVQDVLERMDALARRRAANGEETPAISVGLHVGPVVIGDIGTERRMELAVLGDTVNVASRLEGLTRTLDCRAAISDAAYEAARRETGVGADDPRFAGLEPAGAHALRGREDRIAVWTMR